jgi:hypothetical protein
VRRSRPLRPSRIEIRTAIFNVTRSVAYPFFDPPDPGNPSGSQDISASAGSEWACAARRPEPTFASDEAA